MHTIILIRWDRFYEIVYDSIWNSMNRDQMCTCYDCGDIWPNNMLYLCDDINCFPESVQVYATGIENLHGYRCDGLFI